MTRFQALLITASFSAPVVVGLFLLVVNYSTTGQPQNR
jgi:hypothetical protein